MLSIIIPHFETYEMLKRLLDSIGNRKEIQIIVVDDCSCIDIKSMLNQEYPFVEVHQAEKNGGAGYCRNIGLKYAVGKWILFADADDYFTEDYYFKIEKYFESDYDIIYFVPTSIYNDTGEVADRHLLYEELVLNFLNKPEKVTENYLRYRFLAPWSKLIRNTMVQDKRILFEEVRVANDVMFSIRSGYYAGTLAVDKETIYCVTRSQGTLTTKRNFENIYIRLEEYIKSYLFLKERISSKELKELNWCGGSYWLIALQNKYSIREWYLITKKMVQSRIPIWDKHFIGKTIRAVRKEKELKRYK